MSVPVASIVERGRAALRDGDGATARDLYERALAEERCGDLLEGLARALYLQQEHRRAIEEWECAYAAHREQANHVGAVRVARTLGFMYGAVVGDWAVGGGWVARAQTLLAQNDDPAERGWVALSLGMFETDRARKEECFREALTAGRTLADLELELVSLAYLGASFVHADRTEEGMALLDEALAGVAGSEVDNFGVLEEIFCQLFSACECAHDVARADQWIRVGEQLAARRNLPAVSAFCHTHYGGVLTAAGRWPEADQALTEAVRLWGLGYRSLRAGALVRLADLRVRQGRFEEAEQLLDGLDVDADSARSFAAIHLARGEVSLARDVLERALQDLDRSSGAAVPLLALLVDVHLAARELEEASAAVAELVACADTFGSDYPRAVASLASGRVCLASGAGDPQACLRSALAGFARAQLPMELARTRFELANALLVDQPEVALAEARAALDGFERLQAARDADAASALLRTLGATRSSRKRADGVLTKREGEVLTLLGHGLSNPEISDRLYISRKTVEHHVGNVLSKLGLRSRAEAAAFAARTKPGSA